MAGRARRGSFLPLSFPLLSLALVAASCGESDPAAIGKVEAALDPHIAEEAVVVESDTFVDALASDYNYSASTDLITDRYARSLLRFSADTLDAKIAGRQLIAVTLRLSAQTISNPGTFQIHRMTRPYDSTSATFNCARESTPGDGVKDCVTPEDEWDIYGSDADPPYELTPSGTVDLAALSGSTIEIDVTDEVLQLLSQDIDPRGSHSPRTRRS